MNLVGKIFIILIFVMSVVFMGFVVAVYAAHTNWRNLVVDPDTGLEAQLKNEKLELERVREELTKTEKALETEELARQNQIALLENENDSLSDQIERLNRDYDVKNDEARKAIAAMAAAHQSLADIRDQLKKLDDDILAASTTRDAALASLIAKTDEANGLAIQMQTLRKQMVESSDQLQKAISVLRKFGLEAEPAKYNETPPTGLEGRVLAVRRNGMLEISIGEDDGLRKGHRLDVVRPGQYLGKVEVIETSPDRAVCQIVPQFRKGSIQVQDRVTTGLQSQ